ISVILTKKEPFFTKATKFFTLPENNNILPSIDMLIKISKFFSVSTDFLLELDDRRYLEITGLTEAQLSHIQQIIRDITGANM
ncbi:MAG TPA: hypothetical protein H9852_04155, partial [Candidatus Mediterraneibacter colneyensis]|nr:hypothetical protein [Candidatus Mediterraneibacter colneyensis]